VPASEAAGAGAARLVAGDPRFPNGLVLRPGGRTLFLLTADNSNPEYCRTHATGRIETVAVDVPGAGRP
jgi:hypothetical protein